MARNIEIKARIASVEALLPVAVQVAGMPPTRIQQDDTFFRAAQGRLKLRRFADGSAELIHYDRPDTDQARASDYVRVEHLDQPQAQALEAALVRACGLLGRVRKQRWLVLAGQTRIHLDRVEGLGDFMELEVVLRPGQHDDEGQAIAHALMVRLGLVEAPRIAGAYLDLQPDAAAT